jgi:uncharacterized membrane protein YfcA
MLPHHAEHHSTLAFLYAVPIAILGGLMGLGGAEFRLPVLAGPLGYAARQAIPLNLVVSLVTLSAAAVTRWRTVSLAPLAPLAPELLSMVGGAVVAAFFGASLAGKLSDERLERIILVLLVVIGAALIVEGFLPTAVPALVPAVPAARIVSGVMFGLGVGIVSSLLGVAGGELIIPTLVIAFGADIKTAGTGSLLVSLPTVLVGLLRYGGRGAFADRQPLTRTVAPMGVGSVIGAVIGGLLVGLVPAAVLKVLLGIILIGSSVRIFRHTKEA